MADNVNFQSSTPATPAANTSVATDDVSGQHFQKIKIADGAADSSAMIGGDATNGLDVDVTRVQGTVQMLGSIQGVGTFQVLGTVQAHGTNQALGTFQPLAGSVHLASNLPGGSINAQGVVAHDSAAGGNPILFGAFGSSGTQAAVNDGDAVRLWADLNGRLQVRGTIDSLPNITVSSMPTTTVTGTVQTHGTSQVLGSVQTVGTSQVLGTVQTHGTSQVLGTTQPLAGSVHLANVGTFVALGSVAHDAAVGGAPVLIGAFGSSGTQAAVGDGDAVRMWADLNGRLQVRGTIDSLPNVTVSSMPTVTVTGTVQTHGTSQVLGTIQPLAGSVHVANTAAVLGSVSAQGYVAHDAVVAGNPVLMGAFGSSGTQAAVADGDAVRLWADLNGRQVIRGTIDAFSGTIGGGTVQVHGTAQVLGTVQTHGTSQVLGTVQAHGTAHVGSVQRLAGTVLVKPNQASEGFFGSIFTAATTNGTLVPAPGQGTFVRVWDLIASGSAAGTAFFEFGDGTQFGAIFTADKGGLSFNSAKGVRTNGTNQDILFNCAAGSWGASVNYSLEIA